MKIKEFINGKSEITGGEILIVGVSTVVLYGMGLYLNSALYKSRKECINLEYELAKTKLELRPFEKQILDDESEID